jgi:hypothetical protein
MGASIRGERIIAIIRPPYEDEARLAEDTNVGDKQW